MLKEAIYSSFAQVEYCMSVMYSMRFSFLYLILFAQMITPYHTNSCMLMCFNMQG